MARFLNDQAKLVMYYESGTYGNLSGTTQWIGQVQSHDIPENENVIQTRYLGQLNRNVGQFNFGPYDLQGAFEYYPQDWKLLGFALGSISVTSGTNNTFGLSQVNGGQRGNAFTSGTLNPFISFGLEESRTSSVANQNFVRTLRGCVVNSYTLNISQGEPVMCEVRFIGQTGSWTSGNSAAVTAGSNRPYLWSDTTLSIPGGTTQETVKNLTLTINNNFEAPHYINGSREIAVPYPLNMDLSLTATQDLESSMCGSLYNSFFLAGSLFNSVLTINNTFNTGSHRLDVTLSGCRITEMTVPVNVGGISEVSYTIVPGSISAVVYDTNPQYTLV